MPILDLAHIAALEEARQARGLSEIADQARPIAGGIMARGVPGTWTNSAVALGMDTPVTAEDIATLIHFFTSVGAEPRVELCPFAHPSLLQHLADGRFVISTFENTFFREIHLSETVRPLREPPPGLILRFVDPANEREVADYARVAVSGFFPTGHSPTPDDLAISMRAARHPRSHAALAILDNSIVGAGCMEVSGHVAGLFGLSVLPDFRRRGIQQALIAFRLNYAIAQGARIATISSRPGISTERNVRRMGFQLAYTKPILVRPGPGLKPVLT